MQYLTNPRAVFAEMQRVLKPGGMAVVAFSHRCFIEKAASRQGHKVPPAPPPTQIPADCDDPLVPKAVLVVSLEEP